MDDPRLSITEQVALEKLRYSVAQHVDLDAIANGVDVELEFDYMAKRLVAVMTASVAGRNMEDIVLDYPASAWAYFVRDYMPRWYSKRFPPKMAKYVVRPVELYPHVAIPEMDPVIHFEKREGLYDDTWPTD